MTKDHDRLILHCDCNNFFASCEYLERPELRDVPMAVADDPVDPARMIELLGNNKRAIIVLHEIYGINRFI